MYINFKHIIILLLPILVCCGQENEKINCKYKFFTAGLNVCSEEFVNSNEIEYAVGVVEEKVSQIYPKVSNLPDTFKSRDLNLYIVDSPLATDCEKINEGTYRCDDVTNGINVGSKDIYLRYNKCLAFIPIGHELLHSIEIFYLLDVYEKDHKTPYLFTVISGVNSIEAEIFRDLIFNVPSCVDEAERYR